MPDLRGRLIDDGRLLLLDTLGSGAYGRVYRALDKSSPSGGKHYYAVKCLYRPEPGSYQAEFQSREFANHKRVADHPNVITLHKVVFDRNYVYVILDLCDGGDLFSAITEKQMFHNNDRLVKTAFTQLIDAVQYCHDRGVFHRDIKPENVLCSEDGAHIWLADFGLSTRNHVSKDLGCGSSYYMSPECIGKELALGRYSTRHSDIWSLGVILTNMISGRNPWRYATTQDDCFSAFVNNRNFLRQVLPISMGANEILKRVFRLNPLTRISLPDLRQETLDLDTFFLTSDGPSANKGSNQIVATRAQAPAEISKIQGDTPRAENPPPEDDSAKPSDREERSSTEAYVGPSPYLRPVGLVGHENGDTPVDSLSSNSSSEGESEGPITPATNPIDPDIEVPELPEDGLGKLISQSPANGEEKKPPARRTLLRMAFQKLKVSV
ncbi:hypothetical protein AX16_000973 [Volvariella volvacea WC 439]|nr:hypothetical protein AX16_000973 [Volvariella volvacea WC 439]